MGDAIERAREVIGNADAAGIFNGDPAIDALRDLLAEIDAGVWLDTRELEALGSVDLGYDDARLERHSPLWKVTHYDADRVRSWVALTAADAVRAAREAADA